MTTYDGVPGQDLLAVQRSDELLDALARRADPPDAADDAADPVAELLRAFNAEVDAGLMELLAAGPTGDAGECAVPLAATGRRRAARSVATAAVLVGALSVSGVAAAVTGDPFSPYKSVFHAVQGGDDELPPKAALAAQLQRRLAGLASTIAHGDLAAARATLEDVSARMEALPVKERRAFLKRLAALEAKLARGEAAAERSRGMGAGRGDQGKSGPRGKDAPAAGGSTGKDDPGSANSVPAGKKSKPGKAKVSDDGSAGRGSPTEGHDDSAKSSGSSSKGQRGFSDDGSSKGGNDSGGGHGVAASH